MQGSRRGARFPPGAQPPFPHPPEVQSSVACEPPVRAAVTWSGGRFRAHGKGRDIDAGDGVVNWRRARVRAVVTTRGAGAAASACAEKAGRLPPWTDGEPCSAAHTKASGRQADRRRH